MKTKRFSLITILAVILLAFTTLFGINLKSDKASAAVVQTEYAKVMAANGGTDMGEAMNAYQINAFTQTPKTFEALVYLHDGNNWLGAESSGAIIGGRHVGTDSFSIEIGEPSNELNDGINNRGKVRFIWRNGEIDWMTNTSVVTAHKWTHIVVVRDESANTIKCYVNGQEVAGTYTSKSTLKSGIGSDFSSFDVNHWIGRDGRNGWELVNGTNKNIKNNFFEGKINYVGVSASEKSAADVDTAYKGNKRLITSGLYVKELGARTYYRAENPLMATPNTFTATINMPVWADVAHWNDVGNLGKVFSMYNGDGSTNNIEMAVDNNGHIRFIWDEDNQNWNKITAYFDTPVDGYTGSLDVRTGQDVHVAVVRDRNYTETMTKNFLKDENGNNITDLTATTFKLYINGVHASNASFYLFEYDNKNSDGIIDTAYTHDNGGSPRKTGPYSIQQLYDLNYASNLEISNETNTVSSTAHWLIDRIIKLHYIPTAWNADNEAIRFRAPQAGEATAIDFVPTFDIAIGEDPNVGPNNLPFPGKILDVAMYSSAHDDITWIENESTILKTTINKSIAAYSDMLANWVLDTNQQEFRYNRNYTHSLKDYSGYGNHAFLCTIGEYFMPESYAWTDSQGATQDWFKASDDEYTLIYVPDTQCTVGSQPTYTDAMFDWIVANKDSMNLQFVMGLGDIIDGVPLPTDSLGSYALNTEQQWDRMAANYKKLSDAGIYWSAITGNHDYDNNSLGALTVRKANNYNTHFGLNSSTLNDTIRTSVIARYHTDGSGTANSAESNDMLNAIYEYTATYGEKKDKTVKYLVVALEFGPSKETLDWATSVISQAKYANHRVLFNTHSLIFADGDFGDSTAKNNPTEYWTGLTGNNVATDGDYMWNHFISKNPNMFLTGSGHIGTDTNMFRTDTGVYGNTVLSMLCDGQSSSYFCNTDSVSGWGDPLILVARVNEKTKTIKYYFYNPINNMMFGAENQWEYDFSHALSKSNYNNEAIKNIQLDGQTASFTIDSTYYSYAEPYIIDANGNEVEWELVDGKFTYTLPTAMPVTVDVRAVTLAEEFTLTEGETKDVSVYIPSNFTFTVSGSAVTLKNTTISYNALGKSVITIKNAKGEEVFESTVVTEKKAVTSFNDFYALTKQFKMSEVGARFRLMWTQFNCGLTYVGQMPTKLAEMVEPKLIFVPKANIDNLKAWATADASKLTTTTKQNYAEGGKYILAGDYVAGLERAGLITAANRDQICLPASRQVDPENPELTYLVGGVKNITAVSNANRQWFVIYYFEYLGQRYYAELPYGSEENVSRSIANVASAHVNKNAIYNNNGAYVGTNMDENAQKWTKMFMDNAITDAINKYNKDNKNAQITNVNSIVDVSVESLMNNVTEQVSATYYDDLLTHKMYLRLTTGGNDGNSSPAETEIEVTNYLDFKVCWEVNDNAYISINNDYITTKKVGSVQGLVKAAIGQWTKTTHDLTISPFNLETNASYVDLSVPDQGYDGSDAPTVFEPLPHLTILPNNDKRIFKKTFHDVKPDYDNNTATDLTNGMGEGTITVTGATYAAGNVEGTVQTTFSIKKNNYTLTIKYVHVNGIKLAEDSVIYLEKGTIYDGKTQTISAGFKQGETIKNAIAFVAEQANNPTGKKLGADKWWVSGLVEKDEEIIITYSNINHVNGEPDVWNGTTIATGFAGGDGTKENPYKIQNGAQLAYLAQLANSVARNDEFGKGQYFELVSSIDLGGKTWTPIASADINLGGSTWGWRYFAGDFNGNGFSISGLYHNTNTGYGLGLFGGVSGTVRNLTVQGQITGGHRLGSITYIVKTGSYARFENINSYVDITQTEITNDQISYVGGIAGAAGSTHSQFINCNNYGDVISHGHYSGGIIGDHYGIGSLIENCVNYGDVTGDSKVGGISGSATQDVLNCVNFGTITGRENASLVEEIAVKESVVTTKEKTLITDQTHYSVYLTDKGEVMYAIKNFGGRMIGGIVGKSSGVTLENVVNYGAVVGVNYVGGLVGFNSRGSINGTNNANVNGATPQNKIGNISSSISAFIEYRHKTDVTDDIDEQDELIALITKTAANVNDAGIVTKLNTFFTENGFYDTLAHNNIVAVGNNIGFENQVENKYKDQNLFKVRFIDEKGNQLYAYKTLSVQKGTYIDRDTSFGIEEEDPTHITSKFPGTTYKDIYGANGKIVVDRASFEAMVHLANYQINRTQGKNYLPDRYWWSGIVSQDMTIDITFTEADVWDGTSSSPVPDNVQDLGKGFAGGTGTKEDPYLISTGEQLRYLALATNAGNQFTNKYFKLTNSINLNNIEWEPIGCSEADKYFAGDDYTVTFRGNFDGNGYTVAGLKVSNQSGFQSHAGLFGFISSNGAIEIKNVVVQGSVTGYMHVGGFAGQINTARTINIISFTDVYGEATTTSYIGGLFGGIDNAAYVMECVNYGDVTAKGSNIGGITGGSYRQTKLTNSINYGNVYAELYHIGGIVGWQDGPSLVFGNVNYGDVKGSNISNSVGGIIGTMQKGSESNNQVVWADEKESGSEFVAVVSTGNKEIGVNHTSIGGAYRPIINGQEYKVLTINYYVEGELYDVKTLALPRGYYGKKADGTFTHSLELTGTGINDDTFYYFSSDVSVASDLVLPGYLPDRLWVAGYIDEKDENLDKNIVENVYYSKVAVEGYDNTGSPVYVWDGKTVASGFGGGVGTETNPYLIENGAQLAYLAQLYNNKQANFGGNIHFKLVNSIDLGGHPWTPIGYVEANNNHANKDAYFMKIAFEANFDGNGKTIANLKVDGNQVEVTNEDFKASGLGLFQAFAGKAKNLTVAGQIINAKATAGGFCASLGYEKGNVLKTGTLDNVLSFVDITGTARGNFFGGLVGLTNSSKVLNCSTYGNVKGLGSLVAGTVGGLYGASVLSNSVNYGNVIGETEYIEALQTQTDGSEKRVSSYYSNGGMVGTAGSTVGRALIENCTNYGSVTSLIEAVGGIAGTIEGEVNISGSKNYGVITAHHTIGGIVGIQKASKDSQGTVYSDLLITDSKNYGSVTTNTTVSSNNANLAPTKKLENGNIVANPDDKGNSNNFVGGIAGIVSAGKLGGTIDNDNAEYFALENLGDITAHSGNVGGIVGDYYPANTDAIVNVRNRGLVTGGTGYNAGGVIGLLKNGVETQATLSKLVNIGNVSGTNSNTPDNVGGIVGQIIGNFKLTDVKNTGTVSGKAYVGGVVGIQKAANVTTNQGTVEYSNSQIDTATNTGSVTATGLYAGGIVGSMGAGYAEATDTKTLLNVTNKASVTGEYYVGGIIGTITNGKYYVFKNLYTDAHDTNISIEATGRETITSNNNTYNYSYVGGLIGGTMGSVNPNVTLTNSYVGNQDYATTAGNGKTTNRLTIGSTTTGSIIGGLIGKAGGQLTLKESTVYATDIGKASLDTIGGVIGHATTGTLNFDYVRVSTNVNITANNQVGGWIGNLNSPNATFKTNSVDNNYSHASAKITANTSVGGLIGYVKNSAVTIGDSENGEFVDDNGTKDIRVRGTINAHGYVGGIIGNIDGGTTNIYNVENLATITATATNTSGTTDKGKKAGGIIGESAGNVYLTGVYNGKDITGTTEVGGIVGYVSGGHTSINTSRSATKTVSGTSALGGVIGSVASGYVTIRNAINDMQVAGTAGSVGGIVGYISTTNTTNNSTFTNVKNNATISGSAAVGGIIGDLGGSGGVNHSVELYYARNEKNVTATGTLVGGLVGRANAPLTIKADPNDNSKFSYNNANVQGSSVVGGLVGCVYKESDLTIVGVEDTNANQGAITGASGGGIGGIVGQINGGTTTLENVSNGNVITGTDQVGGIVGLATNASKLNITNANNNASVTTGTGDVAGGIVGKINKNNTGSAIANINNVTNYADVTGGSKVGGIIGYALGTLDLEGGINQGNVTGETQEIGGLIGTTTGATTISYDSQTVANTKTIKSKRTSDAAVAGGLIGKVGGGNGSNTEITNAINEGVVTASANRVGGLVGQVSEANTTLTIETSKNNATVTGKTATGGIIGFVTGASSTKLTSVTNTNETTITGTSSVGGIIGEVGSGTRVILGAANITADSLEGIEMSGQTTENVVRNLGKISGTTAVGGLVGCSSGTLAINNISTSGFEANNTVITGTGRVGTIIGNINNGFTKVANSRNTGSSISSATSYVGGFIGSVSGSGSLSMTNAYNSVAITNNNAEKVGGIVGSIDTTGSVNIAGTNGNNITGKNYVGGYVGSIDNGSVVVRNINNNSKTISGTNYVGGVVGYQAGTASLDITGTYTKEAKVTGTTNFGKSVGLSVWDGNIPTSVGGLDDILNKDESGNYLIHTSKDLAELSKASVGQTNYGSGSYFKLTSNVDLQEGGWVPISYYYSWGNSPTISSFGGTFDGLNHTVTFEESFVSKKPFFGLFGAIGSATIKDVKLAGSFDNVFYTGGLVSTIMGNNALIDNVDSSIEITGNSDNTNAIVGGIIGQILTGVTGVTIQNCDNTKAITIDADGYMTDDKSTTNVDETGMARKSNCVGGIVAIINPATTVTITNCTNIGNITNVTEKSSDAVNVNAPATNGERTGGIVGELRWWANSGFDIPTLNMTGCTNSGIILAGGAATGGVIGYSAGYLTIKTVTNTKNVTGTINVGGIIGVVVGGTTINESGLTNSGTTIKAGSTEPTAKVGTASPWVGYVIGQNDGTSVWDGSYPTTNGAIAETLFEKDANGYYLIQSAKDLATLAVLSKGAAYGNGLKFKQTVNIDLSKGGWYGIGDSDGAMGGYIGTNVTTYGFDGEFDGTGKTIKMQENSDVNHIALFWAIRNGTVKNLVIDGSISSAIYSGTLAARVCGSATIQNITNKATLTMLSSAGNGNNYGGMIGYISNNITATINISDCVNEGNIVGTSNGAKLGGILGSIVWHTSGTITLTITNCDNKGNISGGTSVGGIIGDIEGKGSNGKIICTMTGCDNTGNITATTSKAGGIIGAIPSSITITFTNNTHATGTITAGGVNASANYGTSDKYSGYLIGQMAGTIV